MNKKTEIIVLIGLLTLTIVFGFLDMKDKEYELNFNGIVDYSCNSCLNTSIDGGETWTHGYCGKTKIDNALLGEKE